MTRTLPTISCLAVLPAVCAQAPAARAFYPDDYRTVACADLASMRARGIWGDIEASAFKLVLGTIERQAGFPMDRLDRATVFPALDVGGQLAVLEGNAALALPEDPGEGRYRVERIGSHELLLDEWNAAHGVVQVSDEIRVSGPEALLRPVLAGEPRAGRPSADVMSLLAGSEGLLAWVVAEIRDDGPERRDLVRALHNPEWPAGDAPTFVCLRLRATGDPDDPHLVLEAVVRHGTRGEGLAVTEQAVDAMLARLREMPEARLFRPLLEDVGHERDGTDAVYRVDLGRSRHAAGLFGALAPMMMVARTEVRAVPAQVELVEVVEEEPPPPEKEPQPKEPPPKKPPPKKPGGGGGGAPERR